MDRRKHDETAASYTGLYAIDWACKASGRIHATSDFNGYRRTSVCGVHPDFGRRSLSAIVAFFRSAFAALGSSA